MNYFLAFTLDKEGYKALPLCYGSYDDICIMTSKLNSSADIRKKYENKISDYQGKNQTYLDNVRNSSGRNYTGEIVIYENSSNGLPPYIRVRVLYKRDLIIFKKIMKLKEYVRKINTIDFAKSKKNSNYNRLFSDFLSEKIHFDYDKDLCQRELNKWMRAIKQQPNYLWQVRKLLKDYENLHDKLSLPTPNQLYIEYLNEEKNKLTKMRDEVRDIVMPNPNFKPLGVYLPDSDTYFSDEDLQAWKRIEESNSFKNNDSVESENHGSDIEEQMKLH